MQVDGSVALVSGGASGLGAAVVDALSRSGSHVVSLDVVDGAPSAVDDTGVEVLRVVGDVRDPRAVEAAVEQAEALGGISICVNCAGIDTPRRLLDREGRPHDLELFRQLMEVNLVGTFNVTRLAAAAMARREPVGAERGVIVNTSSIVAFDGQIGHAAYAASKAGIVGMTLPLARELGAAGIRVVTIAPGLFETPLTRRLDRSAVDDLSSAIPFPVRFGRPEEFAQFVSDVIANPYVNGTTVRLDGALRL